MSPELQPEVAGEPSPAGALAPAHAMVSGARARETLAFKFGGSSLDGAARMRHAAGLVRAAAERARVTVVVSAMRGVTDRLLGVARLLEEARHRAAALEAEIRKLAQPVQISLRLSPSK